MSRSFRALVRFFFFQFFQVEAGVSEGGINPTAILALLASPGFIMSVVLFAKYSSLMRWFHRVFNFDREIASQPDKYTFIVLSMTVAGLVVMLRWESMFPDRRDFANLAPLPLSARTVLTARTLALGAFMLIFLVTTNFFPMFVFPMVVMEREGNMGIIVRFIWAHAISVTAAGLFSFAACLALTGLVMATLPYTLFRRAKRYIQASAVAALLFLFLSTSGMHDAIKAIRTDQHTWGELLPSIWFLGLYQQLQGHGTGLFPALAQRAIPALGIACVLAAIAYGLSYRWFYLRTSETVEGTAAAFPVPRWLLSMSAACLPRRAGFYRGAFAFALRTIARSDRHSGALAIIVGLGLALAVQSVNLSPNTSPVPIGQLSATLLIVYAIVMGLRLCFGIPAELRANWIFRLTTDDLAVRPERIARAVMYLFCAIPIVGSSVIITVFYGWPPALMHAAFSVTATALLIDGVTADFRVIPFTCAWMPGRQNLPYTLALFLAGMGIFSQLLAAIDLFLMHDPPRLFVYLATAFAGLLWLRRVRAEHHEPMVWSDTRGELDLLRIAE
jgi:hypothetical protein